MVSCNETRIEEEPIVDTTPVLDEYIFRGIEAGKTVVLPGKNLDKTKWKSHNPFCATAEGGILKPHHIGFTNIFTTSPESFNLWVLVTPKYTDYDLPHVCQDSEVYALDYHWPYDGTPLWNSSPASISIYESAKEKDMRSTSSLQVYKTGNTRSPYVCYFFQNGKLTQAGTIISLSSLNNLPAFLNERYKVISVDMQNYSAYFEHSRGENETIDYVGGIQYFSQLGGILLALLPYSGTKSLVDLNPMAEALVEMFNEKE